MKFDFRASKSRVCNTRRLQAVRLLTEGLEVRILPEEPPEIAVSKLLVTGDPSSTLTLTASEAPCLDYLVKLAAIAGAASMPFEL